MGEGLADTVKREFMEETATHINVLGLFYANDFLQISAFDPREQLISIYYLVSLAEPLQVAVTDRLHGYSDGPGDQQAFRWVQLGDLNAADFRFPVDKIVVEKLLANRMALENLVGDGDLAGV